MAYGSIQGGYQCKTYEVGGAYNEGTAVYLKSDGIVYQITDTSKPPTGWMDETSTASGEKKNIRLAGPTMAMRCGAAVTVGSLLQLTTAGEVIDATTDNVWVVGQALEAGVDHALIEVLLLPHVTNDVSGLDAD